MSKQSFAELGVSRAVIECLETRGITSPFAIQREVIEDILAGRDVLARSPTGSGKTLAFGIPVVDRIAAEARRPAALILAPTRELATQIVEEIQPIAHARALRVTAVYGGVGLLKQGQNAAKSHIIVATPGRLEDQLKRGAFRLDQVQVLILDEADRMLDMGFKPAVDRIVRLCPDRRQTLFFSATLDGAAGAAARSYTVDPVSREHGPSQRRASDDVDHHFINVTHDGRFETLVETLEGPRELTLVFVRTKHGADKLVKRLGARGLRAVAMHGNKTQSQRERALAAFESWDVDTLVATDVAARGIDVGGISHVINFDPPHDSETYVHRVGRTGRAGARGVGITLVSPDQSRDVGRIASELALGAQDGRNHATDTDRDKPARQGGRPHGRRSDKEPAKSGRPQHKPKSGHSRNPNGGSRRARHGHDRSAGRPA